MDINHSTNVIGSTVNFGKNTTELRQAVTSTSTTTLDCSQYNVFVITLAANITTLTLSNVPASGNTYSATLFFVQGASAYTVAFPGSIKWAGGASAPTITTTNGKIDIITLTTYDGGSNWFGLVGGQNF